MNLGKTLAAAAAVGMLGGAAVACGNDKPAMDPSMTSGTPTAPGTGEAGKMSCAGKGAMPATTGTGEAGKMACSGKK